MIVRYDVKSVAAQIKILRLQKNYTQDYMAHQLKISQNAYSKIELGYTNLSLERFFAIAIILDTDAVELIRT